MSKKMSFLSVAVSILLASSLFAGQVNSTWVGGSRGDWEIASNWNPPTVPDNNATQTYAVTIDDAEVDLKQSSRTIDQLDCDGNVVFGGYHNSWVGLTTVEPNGLRNHGYLSTESRMWLNIDGNLDNPQGCTIDTAVNGGIEVDGNVENAGRIMSVPPAGLLYGQVHNVGEIIIFGGVCVGNGVLDNDSTGTIKGFGAVGGWAPFTNKGKVYATGGGLTIAINGSFVNRGIIGNAPSASINVMNIGSSSDASNFGTIEVNPGGGVAFDCNILVACDCNLVNEPNGIIKLLGGTLGATKITQKAGAMFEGDGKISGNLVIEPNANVVLTGPTEIYGDVQIDANAVLDINDGTTLIKGHCTCNNGTIHLKGGWIIPQGGLTNNNCNILWEPGLYNNVADFNLDGKVDFKDFANFADTWLWQASWY